MSIAIATPAVVAASSLSSGSAFSNITVSDAAVSARAYGILTTEFVGVHLSGDDLKDIRDRARQELIASAQSATSGIAAVHAALQLAVAH